MATFYVLRIQCIEDDCRGSDECHQVYWFKEMIREYEIDIETLLGSLDSHAIEIVSPDASEYYWYEVRAELIELKGCRASFKQGLEMGREEAFLTCDEQRVSHTLLPRAFVPRVAKTKTEAHHFTSKEQFKAFFKEKTKTVDITKQKEEEAATTRKQLKLSAE